MPSRPLPLAAALLAALFVSACATSPERPPLEAIDERVDLERFMGDWYVLAHIPIDTWLGREADAYNGVERRFDELVGIVEALGHDVSRLRRVPQRWPE